jgi:quercetin dioxygenase-like cupin family protein
MPHLDQIKPKELTSGIIGKYVHGTGMTAGWVTIKAGSDLAVHQHPHVIPSNTPHGAVAHTDCVLIDVFSPVREEYR